jgi:hypothetical protein
MDKTRIEMLEIYKPISGLDWLNYKLVKDKVTFHHIKKRDNGGKKVVNNGALLMPVAHQYLHLIESKDMNIYIGINKIFEYINQQQYEPTAEQRQMLEYLLLQFENQHRFDKGSKGKMLIKHKYLERW